MSKGERGTLGDSLRGPCSPCGYGAAIQEGREIGEGVGGEVTAQEERRWWAHSL
ncbi:hypothetical protein Hanom_Chr01g00058101 [Helianthus anomalus]